AAVNANPLLFVGDTPDATATQTIYDSLGNAHQITLWFFQSANLNNVPPAAANRPTWQWYAFDTTGGPASAANCLAGTDITTTWINPTVPPVNVAQTNSLIWFNQDGSLASNGGLNDIAAVGPQAAPFIVLPVVDNAQGQTPDGAIGDQMVTINFGNSNVWNAAGQVEVNVGANSAVAAVGDLGDRSGLTGDVDGSFSTINGAQVYTANNTVYG